MVQDAVRLYNTSFFYDHLQSKIVELTKKRKESKNTFEQASLGDQINLVEQLQRDFKDNVKEQLGGK